MPIVTHLWNMHCFLRTPPFRIVARDCGTLRINRTLAQSSFAFQRGDAEQSLRLMLSQLTLQPNRAEAMVLHQSTGSGANTPNSPEDIFSSLSRKCAFCTQVESVVVRQTHISAVFLGDDTVYKVKKPVKLPFLDFSNVELRHHFCEEEARINRPWAPDVYLGVVPVTREATGFRFEGNGPVVDWAVKMRRLPESATLRSRLNDGLLEPLQLERVARRIATIHRQAVIAAGDEATTAECIFRRRLNENWEFARDLKFDVIQPEVLQRLQKLSSDWLSRHDNTLRQRAERGKIRDVHGDLRLEHVFFFPDQSPPGDILILDGIEFDPSLRRIDLTADVAFLAMELSFLGRRDLATVFTEAYFSEFGDDSGKSLLPLFAAYRSAVRAKVAAILCGESEIPQPDRDRALVRSRAHWLWCLSELEEPYRRPALVMVSGLPGTGKSTLSRMLGATAHFEVLRSDVVRKELYSATVGRGDLEALYSAECTQRVYGECLYRARQRLLTGGRIIVDATFQTELQRQSFLQMAIDSGARVAWLECTAPEDVTRQRLDARQGDASDADWSVYQIVHARWESPSEFTGRFHSSIESGSSSADAMNSAQDVIKMIGLAE